VERRVRRRFTRREILRRAGIGGAIGAAAVGTAAWAAPVVETIKSAGISSGSPVVGKCFVVKLEPGECQDLYGVPVGQAGNTCLADTTTGVMPGGCSGIAGYQLNTRDSKAWVLTLPSGCTFETAYSKAMPNGCDLQETATGQNSFTFRFVEADGKRRGVSNVQFTFCCP
jgi:hypothetical protein